MSNRQDDACSGGTSPGSIPPPRKYARIRMRRLFFWAMCLGLVLICLNILGGIIDSPLAYAVPLPSHIVLKGAPSHPNKMSPTAGAQSLTRSPQLPPSGTAPSGTPQIISHNMQMSMKAGSVALQPGAAVSFVGSDKRLELDIPAGAITAQDLQAAGGTISLHVTQVAPASGSNAGGSGEFSLGTYLLQLVDAQEHLLSHGLRKPLVARYHLQKGEQNLYLDHAYVLLNGTLSQGAASQPGVVHPATTTSLVSTLGARQVQKVSLDTTRKTLTASPLLSTPSTSLSWNDDSPVATFGKPDPSSVSLSSGSLSYQEQLDLPDGPGGLTPPVSLTYSSEAVNEQHNPSAAAGWVGEGWNLSAGEISWSESNVLAGCSNSCSPEWESVWNISDAYGTSSQLIPPNINVSSYYDDSPNYYCATGNSAAYPCPIRWHTATESHDKIYMYVGPVTIGQPQNPPCWRVWLPNGIMEEFGCTSDSLQYYYEAGLGALITGWKLDLITDPQGNQIHFTYQRDMENWTSPVTGKTYSYPRDVQLSTISYDSPGCHSAQTMCTGSSWAPLIQIVFNASHAPAIRTGSAPSGCNTGSNLRCDDPLDLSGNGGHATSLIQNTFVLNTIQIQVRTSGSGSWNTRSTYKLGYEQSGPSTITDPANGLQRSVAGMLDLTQFQKFGSDGSTTLPMTQFSYTSETNTYVDSFFHPNPSTNCGPSWNTGNGSGCLLWNQTYAGNNRFLSSVSNGQGLASAFSWKIAHNNSHGAPGGGSNNANPFACDSSQSGYPCNEADDSGWSHAVLTQQKDTTIRLTQNGQDGQQTSAPITETTNYSYLLTYPLTAQECSDCVAGMYWGNQNDNDYLGFYNGVFMGFAQATVNLPTGGVEIHDYYAGEGWGLYDTSQVTCYTKAACHNDPWWALANAAHGQEYQVQSYDADGTTLLSQVNTTYSATCPPSGVSGTPSSSTWGNWDGKLVSELDHNNPVVVCDIQQTQQVSKTYDGATSPLTTTTNWSYDSYGRVTQETTTSNGGTPGTVVHNTSYVWNDSVTATQTSASGTYIIDTKAFTDAEDGSGNRLSCNYASYDGQSYTTGQTSSLTSGLATTQTSYASCGTSANGYTTSGPSTTTTKYDVYGNKIGSSDPDANAGISGHTGCAVSGTAYTSCTTYDSTFDVFPTATGNALNQTSSTSYGNTGSLFGYGTWPQSTTDVNGQTTSYTYDALGRMTGETLPGETSGEVTKQWIYTNWCSGTSAQAPCEEIDEIDRLSSSTTTTTRAFYDGEGRLVETRAPGPVGQDVVTYATYDSAGRQIFKSNPYFVTAYTGSPGAAAYSIPDSTQPGTTTNYYPTTPNLRTTSVTDPNSHTTTTTVSVICGVPGTSDTGCYEQSTVVDANGHEHATLVGGLGKTNYTQTYTGTSGSYTLYATTTATYDAAGQLLSTKSPDGSTTTSVYDDLGHVISQSDPDRGTTALTYDPNGNLTEAVDARGSTGTVFTGYDGLNRPLWQNSTNSPSGAWVTNTYDSTANGNHGIGHLTGESFTGSGGLSGSYAYTYDSRGQQTGETVTVNGTSYPVQATYNDNGQLISKTYPTGEVVTNGYDANGWLTSLNTQSGSTVTTLASNLAYTGLAGAAGKITTMDYGNGTIYTASYDTGMRLTSASLTQASTNALLYQTQPAYDAANNVVSVATSITGSTDTQQFCYDSLNRLTWAGSTGTPPCAGLTPGTLTAAQYQQSESYNVENGLTSGPGGSYTYGDTNHPHAVTATSSGYSAAYDAAGNMICRALSSATTCSGSSPTGQQLSYDPAGRLSSWQNQPSSPSSTANYLYDGSGNRVAMLTTVNGTTTLTAYIGSIEEVQITGGATSTTTYYAVGGMRIAANVNGTFDYFGYDALGSQVIVLNNSGNVIGSQLYGPYGNPRYSAGTLPTSIGFTGQQADSVTGLDYYVARYYDPVIGQFLSADTDQGNAAGVSPYAYVGGNPETRTDPTGQRWVGGNGETGWINPGNGNIYVEQPGSLPKVIGHVNIRPPSNTSTGSTTCGGGGKMSAGACNRSGISTCDTSCRADRDKRLLKQYEGGVRKKREAIANIVGDVISIGGDIVTIIADLGQWGKEILNLLALIVHLGDLVYNWAIASGAQVPSVVGAILNVAKGAVAFLNGIRALLDLFTPNLDWLANLLQSFLKSGKNKIAESVGLALSSTGTGVGALGTGVVDLTFVPSDDTINGYSPDQALKACQGVPVLAAEC